MRYANRFTRLGTLAAVSLATAMAIFTVASVASATPGGTFTLSYAAGNLGTITGASEQTVNAGGSGSEVVAFRNTGYHFSCWSDGVNTAARTDSNVTRDIAVDAEFAIDNYTLAYTAGPGGTISGTSPQVRSYGDDGATVVAIPDSGYHFIGWSDGATTAERTDREVSGNVAAQAQFTIDSFALSYTAGPGGFVSGASWQIVHSGCDGTEVTAVPDPGHYFLQWSDGATSAARTDSAISGNVTARADFAIEGNPVAVPAFKPVDRLGGATRYEVTLAAAEAAYPAWTGVTDLVVASGEDRAQPDALTGAGLAGTLDAPLVLVPYASVSAQTRAAIANMPAGLKIHVVGGPASVSSRVQSQLAAITGVVSVDRVSGHDRYAVAAAIARRMKVELVARGKALPSTTLIVNGDDPSKFYDALAASAVSAHNSYPVLLVQTGSVPAATRRALTELGLSDRYIVGGSRSVCDAVRISLGVVVGNRISGANRYATATAVAERARSEGWLGNATIAFAAAIPDAATGGALMGKRDGALLYVSSTGIPAATSTYLHGTAALITDATVLGGARSVPESVRTGLKALIQ